MRESLHQDRFFDKAVESLSLPPGVLGTATDESLEKTSTPSVQLDDLARSEICTEQSSAQL